MIRIEGLTKRQIKIADLLWSCTPEEAEALCKNPEVAVVRDMIVAAVFDEYDSVDIAADILEKFKL